MLIRNAFIAVICLLIGGRETLFPADQNWLSPPKTAQKRQSARRVKEVTGVLYYLAGGTGLGEVELGVGDKVLHIDYIQPFALLRSQGALGYRKGAIWRVRYQEMDHPPLQEDDNELGKYLLLKSAWFSGNIDQRVKSANDMVETFYTRLFNHDCHAAYSLFSKALRDRFGFEKFSGQFCEGEFEESAAGQFGPNMFARNVVFVSGTRVVDDTAEYVRIQVEEAFYRKDSYGYYQFDVYKRDSEWLISDVKQISFDDWNKH